MTEASVAYAEQRPVAAAQMQTSSISAAKRMKISLMSQALQERDTEQKSKLEQDLQLRTGAITYAIPE